MGLVKSKFSKDENRRKTQETMNIIKAYEILGNATVRSTGFRKVQIDLLMKEHEEKTNKGKMKSEEIVTVIQRKFLENAPPPPIVKPTFPGKK